MTAVLHDDPVVVLSDLDEAPVCDWVVGGVPCGQEATWTARCRLCGQQAGLACDGHHAKCLRSRMSFECLETHLFEQARTLFVWSPL